MEQLKTVLFELPPWSGGQLNGIPSPDVFTKVAVTPPRGIGQIAADLMYGIGEQKGVKTEITIVDPRFNNNPWKLDHQDALALIDADIVGGSAVSRTIPQTIECFRICKKYNPRIITVLGGPHGTANDEEMLRTGVVDYVVRGEADFIAIELWSKIIGGQSTKDILGISYLDENGQYVRNPDRKPLTTEEFSSLPLPYDPPEVRQGVNVVVVHTSLGCVYDCEFCAIDCMGGAKNHRRGSIERAMQQIERSYAEFPKSSVIFFGDSNFAPKNNIDWVLELFENIRREYGKLRSPKRLTAQIDIHAALDKYFPRLFQRAGGFALYVGLESLNEGTLKDYKKGATVKQNKIGMRRLRDAGIWSHPMTIAGGGKDTVESLEFMLSWLKREASSAQILALGPLPGSRLGKRLLEEGKVLVPLDENHLENYSLMDGKFVMVEPPETLKMTRSELQQWLIEAHQELYRRHDFMHLLRSLRTSPVHLAYDMQVRRRGQEILAEVAADAQMSRHLAYLNTLDHSKTKELNPVSRV